MTEALTNDMPGAPGEADDNENAPVLSSDAGTDESIAERLYADPENKEARLDRGLDESMDASDPPASTQPVHLHHPPESSGYDAEAEKKLAEERANKEKGLLGKIASKLGLD